MDEDRFWEIIGVSRQRTRERERPPGRDFIGGHMETLAEVLRQLPPADIAAFAERFWLVHRAAYRRDLWAAAYWLHGGCGDDGFIDFRSCLISLGKELYFQVLNDPDSLADIEGRQDIPFLQSEGFQYVAAKVYREMTGAEMPQPEGGGPQAPAGERIDPEDDELMARLFPKLVAKLPDMGD